MTDTTIAIIGGTGLTSLKGLEITRREVMHTPYGEPSGPITHGVLAGREVMFLARHGYGHTIPPHRINYRANLWALKNAGIRRVVAVAAVGGITAEMAPPRLVFPDQIIDYTWSRAHTLFEADLSHVTHVDFTYPYCEELRHALIQEARRIGLDFVDRGTYGATQGPRLETAAEVNRLERDGCDIVGMTGMPEAALARELELCYATCAVVANWAAGRGEGQGEITMEEVDRNVAEGMVNVRTLLENIIPTL
ncbi:S-methyl-5'-thioinosine phosphorylase [Ectothiorhodospira lacustris]|uniref:S-methyl-5'-thioinosine phosphorylase n=1 Tax=Ectothiorhodospira lacustris TaxID=2899127 RepID=UPI001EE978B0|nr:S-methyl-5'-thioinosine phosphorylase [Ectothiorhodospira lacustris]MCG5500776.1 S-methyl-5'-thioinosine phosphorylase [Ectothiorhodospira lacustris]MCG5509341.1 S-methyl-5'-thioinosine phosphorylase [Ectothiorhodospira lacustris]MCG5521395.1 S-methyl-5'-thioinosine phosphorylase [Ectothiorhodospira lacustris]